MTVQRTTNVGVTGEYGCKLRRDDLTPNQKRALDLGDTLGWGSFACVYEKASDPKRVVKLTTDPDDANTIAALGDRKLKSIPHVFGVHALLSPSGKKRSLWAIDVEKVDPLPARSDDARSVAIFNDYLIGKYAPGQFPTKLAPSMKRLVKDCNDAAATGYLNDPARCAVVIKEAVTVYNDLGKQGYTFEDAHSGNWGRTKDGRLVAIDLGFSSNAQRPAAPVPDLAGARRRKKVKMFGAVEESKGGGAGFVLGLGFLALMVYAFTQSKPTVEKK